MIHDTKNTCELMISNITTENSIYAQNLQSFKLKTNVYQPMSNKNHRKPFISSKENNPPEINLNYKVNYSHSPKNHQN